jgi:hypothetical protein
MAFRLIYISTYSVVLLFLLTHHSHRPLCCPTTFDMSSLTPTTEGSQAPSAQVEADYFTNIEAIPYTWGHCYNATVNLIPNEDYTNLDLDTTVVVDDPAKTTFSLAECNDLRGEGSFDRGFLTYRKPAGPGSGTRGKLTYVSFGLLLVPFRKGNNGAR